MPATPVWKQHRFDDLRFHVRVRLVGVTEMEYEVRSLQPVGDGLWFVRTTWTTPGVTQDLKLATVLVTGAIKFHGACSCVFAEGALGSNRSDMVRIGELFSRLYDLATRLFQEDDPLFDARYLM